MEPDGGIAEVWIVGAFDRHNYGDLLFPLLVQDALRSRGFSGSIRFFSTLKSDLGRYGAVPTEKLGAMFGGRSAAGVLVVVAGGEVLAATWSIVLSYLYGFPLAQIIKRISRYLGEQRSAALFSRLAGSPSRMPFVYEPKDFTGMPRIVYNAVGASHLQSQQDSTKTIVARKLMEASFVSVRDARSRNLLEELHVSRVSVAPDSAVLLSSIYPKQALKHLASGEAVALIDRLAGKYICFQSAYTYIEGREELVVDSLRKTIECTGLSVLVLAIGMANGHSDDKSARVLKARLGEDPRVVILTSGIIWDIMLAICSGRVYAGTSLHGAITALSYGIPQLGLCPTRILKLASFMDTWSDKRVSAVCGYPEMPTLCSQLMHAPSDVLIAKQVEVISAATNNFDAMFQAFSGGWNQPETE